MKKFLPLIAALFFAASANAADVYKFDPNHTSVNWSASHFGFSNPSGKFTGVDGTLIINEVSPQNSSVDVTVRIDSLSTGLSKFDSHLKSEDFFDVEKFPTAKFVSTSVTPNGKNAVKVVGNLTMHGITKSIILDAKLNKKGVSPITQKQTVGFSASATIKRSLFNMNYAIPGVSDNVKISIEAEGIFSSSDQPSASGEKKTLEKAKSWVINPSKSKLEFRAMQDSSSVSGSFGKFDGTINFDPAELQSSSVEITVDTSSVTTSFTEASDTLKSPGWFAVKAFPTAVFKANNFTPLAGKMEFRSIGTLTMKGKTLPINLDFTLTEYNKTNARAVGKAVLKRADFGVGERDQKKANGVRDEVTILIDVSAER